MRAGVWSSKMKPSKPCWRSSRITRGPVVALPQEAFDKFWHRAFHIPQVDVSDLVARRQEPYSFEHRLFPPHLRHSAQTQFDPEAGTRGDLHRSASGHLQT